MALGVLSTGGAPQQSAAASIGLTCEIIPHVLMRALATMWEFPCGD